MVAVEGCRWKPYVTVERLCQPACSERRRHTCGTPFKTSMLTPTPAGSVSGLKPSENQRDARPAFFAGRSFLTSYPRGYSPLCLHKPVSLSLLSVYTPRMQRTLKSRFHSDRGNCNAHVRSKQEREDKARAAATHPISVMLNDTPYLHILSG